MTFTLEFNTWDEFAKKIRELAAALGGTNIPALDGQMSFDKSYMGASNTPVSSYAISGNLDKIQKPADNFQSQAETLVAKEVASPDPQKPKRGRGRPPKKKPEVVEEIASTPATVAAPELKEIGSVPEPQFDAPAATSELVSAASTPAAEVPKLEEQAVPESPVVTKDQCVGKLHELVARRTVEAGISVLQTFGVRRFSELSPEHYAAFVIRCDERLQA